MTDDAVLLRRYAEEKSETAFTELVRRHVDLVYSAALRRTGGDAHAAADVAQHVFTRLARDARKLAGHAVLTAWLYAATRNAAVDLQRATRRREIREQEAQRMQELQAGPGMDHHWAQLRPVLDAAMDELPEADRAAVLLRFFERRGFAEIGTLLNLGEDAARMRTGRALEKLRERLARRGITSTTAALAMALGAQAVGAAPAGFVVNVATGALVSAGAAGASASAVNLAASISVAAAAVALAVAWWQGEKVRVAEQHLAASRAETQSWAARTRQLAAETEAMQAAAQARRKAAGPAPAAPNATDLDERTRKFLAAHPEALEFVASIRRRSFDQNLGWRLQAIGVPPAERARLAELALRDFPWEFHLTERGGWSIAPPTTPDPRRTWELMAEKVRAELNDAQRDAYDALDSMPGARELAKAVAVATYDSPEPVTPQQAQGIIDRVRQHGQTRTFSRRVGIGVPVTGLGLDSVDWPAATRDLATLLSPSQMTALDSARANLMAQGQQQSRTNALSVPTR